MPRRCKEVIAEYKKVVKKHAKRDFPQDPHEQLVMARDAVFRSWQNDSREALSPHQQYLTTCWAPP